MITPYRGWASTYLQLGWSPVPLPSTDKHPVPDHSPISCRCPMTSGQQCAHYTGANGQDVSAADVRAWTAPTGRARAGRFVYPVGNIALRLPKDVIGIDVDTYEGKAGAKTLADAEKLWGRLPETWTAANRLTHPGSGIRLYRLPQWAVDGPEGNGYAWPESLKQAPDVSLGGGVELIRWDHRYVVVGPSVHPDGRAYFWRMPNGEIVDMAALMEASDGGSAEVDVELPDIESLTYMPDEWIHGLTGDRPRGAGNFGSVGADFDVDRDTVSAWLNERESAVGADLCAVMDRTLARGLREVRSAGEDGGAHDAARDAVYAILGDSSGGHSGVRKALADLRAAFFNAVRGRRPGAEVASDHGDEVGAGGGGGVKRVSRVVKSEWDRMVIRGVGRIIAEGREAVPEDLCILSATMRTRPGAGGARRGGNPFDYTRDDRGNARRLYNALGKGGDVRWCPTLGGWFLWNPVLGRWICDGTDGIALRAIWSEVVDDMEVEAESADIESATARAELMKFVRGCGNMGRADAAIKFLKSLPGITVGGETFDNNDRLLLCDNGVIELTNDGPLFRPAVREDYLTLSTGTRYFENADMALIEGETPAPGGAGTTGAGADRALGEGAGVREGAALWESFLGRVLPDVELRNWVQMAVGYSLLGSNPQRLLFVAEGPTSTGKSTFVESIRKVLGEHASTYNFSLFRSEREQGPNVALVRLLSRRFIVASEASQERHLHADEVKRLTGNEAINARLNNANEMIERVPAFTPWIVTNSPPTINGADAALYRRLWTIPFNQQISEKDEDAFLGERLGEVGKEAILAWAVRGWKLYREVMNTKGPIGFRTPPPAVQLATRKMQAELNDFSLWTSTRLEPASSETITPTDDLYDDYELWCDANNLKPDNKVWFGRAMGRQGYEKARARDGKVRYWGWRGVRIAMKKKDDSGNNG